MGEGQDPPQRDPQVVGSGADDLVAALLGILPGPLFRIHRNGMITGAWAGIDATLLPVVRSELDDLVGRLPVPVATLLPPDVVALVDATLVESLATAELREVTYERPVGDRLRTIRARCMPCGPDEVLWLPEDLTAREELREARRLAAEQAADRLAFEALLSSCCERLLAASVDDLDATAEDTLRLVAQHFDADVAYVCATVVPGVIELIHQWRGPGNPPELDRSGRVRRGEFRFGSDTLAKDPVLLIRNVSDLPDSGSAEQRLMHQLQNQSLAWVRIGPPEAQSGIIGLSWKRLAYEGRREPLGQLVRLGEALVAARKRREAQRLVDGQNRVLDLVARGATLASSLQEVARLREGPRLSLRCAVILTGEADGGIPPVELGAAPSLGEAATGLVDGLNLGSYSWLFGDHAPGVAVNVDEVPNELLAARLRALGAVTLSAVPLDSVRSGVRLGFILTLDLDPDREPLPAPAVDEACAALASVAVERAHAEAALVRQATHDELTGVANRSALLDRLEISLLRSQRRQQLVAVLYADLDRFKDVNDHFGHDVGDSVLREVAQRIVGAVERTDSVARFGGDEFVVVLDDLLDEDRALAVADRIADAIAARPVLVGGAEVALTASIGVAVSTSGADHPEALVRDADVAMSRAKAGGRARREVVRATMRTEARERSDLARELAHALEHEQLEVHFQPLLRLADERVGALEALVRWQHPERGMIGPGLFIPIAEETGLIVHLGRWVTEQAIRELSELAGAHPQWSGLRVHINLSAGQLDEPGFVDALREALVRWDVPAKQVALEITETVLMAESPSVVEAIRELVELGTELVLDDFGTGYASLTYLRRFPVRGLKIDRSFVSGLGERAEDDAVVRAVVDLARSLDLDLVAEGVETREQADFLREIRCRSVQGYFFARPVPASELVALLHRLEAS